MTRHQKPYRGGSTLPPVINILSWNMQKATHTDWAADLAALGGDAHLVFLQEAAREAAIQAVLKDTEYEHFAPGYRRRHQTTGVMTLSVIPPSFCHNLKVNEPWLRTPKAAGVARYPMVDSEQLLAVNVHAVNFSLGLERLRTQLMGLDRLLQQHSGPVIVAGDLNTWRRGRQRLVDDWMDRHALEPVVFSPDLRSRAFGRALDHVYVRGLAVAHSEVIPVASSDHNALRVQLRLQ